MFSKKRYKVGYMRAKGRTDLAEQLVVPKGPLPDIQPLHDSEVANGH